MELINNIWIALSTPNQLIMHLLSIPSIIIENLLLMILFLILDHKKVGKK